MSLTHRMLSRGRRTVRKQLDLLRARRLRALNDIGARTTTSPLQEAVELPNGLNEPALREFLESVRVTDGPPDELRTYCRGDFWRFVRTYDLVRDLRGRCLELGANPYFTTMLLREFTDLQLVLANYFGPSETATGPRQDAQQIEQSVAYRDRASGRMAEQTLSSSLFNIETERFPFEDGAFDVVLFCEIIEHLTVDPLAALREIKRVLRSDGVLVLTTPNVNRLENVVKMITGGNIYDPYSAYGAYGRHNREYNKHELHLLLTYLGFDVERLESADVQDNSTHDQMDWGRLAPMTRPASQTDWRGLVPLLRARERDLGQYLFVRARNKRPGRVRRPEFLFRSYPAQDVEPVRDAEVHHVA